VTARSTPRAIALGIAATATVLLGYALLSEPLEITFGLLVAGIVGGWLIGHALSYGAWNNRDHEPYRPLQWTALILCAVAWVGALVLAFVITQALVPDSSVPLGDKLTTSNFFDYLFGLDFVPVVHVLAFALMAFMAWRGAR
jgi:hypothetical protein